MITRLMHLDGFQCEERWIEGAHTLVSWEVAFFPQVLALTVSCRSHMDRPFWKLDFVFNVASFFLLHYSLTSIDLSSFIFIFIFACMYICIYISIYALRTGLRLAANFYVTGAETGTHFPDFTSLGWECNPTQAHLDYETLRMELRALCMLG